MSLRTFASYATLVLLVTGDVYGQSPALVEQLLNAIATDQSQAAQALLTRGADPNAKNRLGVPAIVVAAANGSMSIVTALIAKGASVDARDVGGRTALMVAAIEGHSRIMLVLIGHGAEVNARDSQGLTPLMLAVSQCQKDAVKALWIGGADMLATDQSGNSVRSYAERGKCQIVLRRAALEDCKDVSEMYRVQELKGLQPMIEAQLARAKKLIEERAPTIGWDATVLTQATVVTSIAKACTDAFGFATYPGGRIVMPMFSVKLIRDLLSAESWLLTNKFELKIAQYVNILKYKRRIDFSGGQFPSPFDALGIPQGVDGSPLSGGPALRKHIDTIFDGALFFLLAHEAAHLIRNDTSSSPTAESIADEFAFEMALRTGHDLRGVGSLFAFQSYWSPNGGDFEDPLQYRSWLGTTATHPASPSRLRLLAARVYRIPDRSSGLSESEEQGFRDLGSALMDDSKRIEDHTRRSDLFWDALLTTPSMLAPTRQ